MTPDSNHLDGEIINDDIVKGAAEQGLELYCALAFCHDGVQWEAVAKGELGLPAAVQREPGPQLCLHTAGKPAAAQAKLQSQDELDVSCTRQRVITELLKQVQKLLAG